MIKRHANHLLLITAVFAAFTLGFFTGRNYSPSPVQVSTLQSADQTSRSQLLLQAPPSEATQALVVVDPAASTSEVSTTATAETTLLTETAAPNESVPKATASAVSNATQTQDAKETSPRTETIPPTEAPAPTEEATHPTATEAAKTGLININTASAAELMTLPGIGEVLSQRIVEYREANGPFPSVAALTNVSGIGEKRLAAIIHLVTV